MPNQTQIKNDNREMSLIDLLTRQNSNLLKFEKANSHLLTKLEKADTENLVDLIMDRKSLIIEIKSIDEQIKAILSDFKEKNSSILNINALHLLKCMHIKASSINHSLALITELGLDVQRSLNSKLNGLVRGNKLTGSYVLNNKKNIRYEING